MLVVFIVCIGQHRTLLIGRALALSRPLRSTWTTILLARVKSGRKKWCNYTWEKSFILSISVKFILSLHGIKHSTSFTCLPKGKVKIMVYQSSLWHRERNAKLSNDTLTEQHFDQHVFQKLGNCCSAVFSLTCFINCCAMDAYFFSYSYSFILKYWSIILFFLKLFFNFYSYTSWNRYKIFKMKLCICSHFLFRQKMNNLFCVGDLFM